MNRVNILLAFYILSLFTLPAAGMESQQERPECLALIAAIDVSGSMRGHGFDDAKTSLIGMLHDLRPCDIFYIIPFAETKIKSFRGELTIENREKVLEEVEAFVRGLRPGGRKGDLFGHYTNLDEGIDAATLAALKESGAEKRIVVLISDGISDPDPMHKPLDLNKLAERIPKGAFNLYFIDLFGRELQGLERIRIGEFNASSQENIPIIVIPLKDTGKLLRLLRQVEEQERKAIPQPQKSEQKTTPIHLSVREILSKNMGWLILIIIIALLSLIFFLKVKKKGNKITKERRMLIVKVDEKERRYSLPVAITLGGGDDDSIRIPKTKQAELTLNVSEIGNGSFLHNNQQGGIYGGREFTLSNGKKVQIHIEAIAKREAKRHRYLA